MTEIIGKTHAMRAMFELRQRIFQGKIAGGTRLLEVALAEDLKISRTPIREAMSRLAEEGLLERGPNGGFIVRSFSYSDAIDAIELRGVLEGMAARLAAERGVEEKLMADIRNTVAELDKCFTQDTGEVEFEAYSHLNAQFHTQLAGLSGSKIIRQEVERATSLPFASPSAFLPDETDVVHFKRSLTMGQEQHRAIINAIAAKEGARAAALLQEHARAARQNLELAFLNEQNNAGDASIFALVRE